MNRKVQIIFPNNSASIIVDYTPQMGEIINHNELGKGIVGKILTFISREEIPLTNPYNQQQRYEEKCVTKIILIDV